MDKDGLEVGGALPDHHPELLLLVLNVLPNEPFHKAKLRLTVS